MSNIVIPPKINVGFQNRKDTYTGKLAYVIYFDDKGKLHKEPSWNGWRDEKIPNEIYENEPLEGFVLNKKAGGYKSGWDFRQTYARVYDPRGFEFEITVENLLWILESNNCIKGKGLEGKYIYGWSGGDLVLVPISSPDYVEIKRKNEIRQNNDFIKAKDLIVGATYRNINDEIYLYMGRYDCYSTSTHYDKERVRDGYSFQEDKYCYDGLCEIFSYKYSGKQYCFLQLRSENLLDTVYSSYVNRWKSIPKKFIECVDATCHPNYKEWFEKYIESNPSFSLPDFSKTEIIDVSYEDFESYLGKNQNEDNRYGNRFYYLTDNGEFKYISIEWDCNKEQWRYCTHHGWYSADNSYHYFTSVREIFDTYHICYAIKYLENGKIYQKVGDFYGK